VRFIWIISNVIYFFSRKETVNYHVIQSEI